MNFDYYEMQQKLEEYAREEGTEVGETWSLLAGLLGYPDYVSDEFKAALHKEAKDTLEFIKENYTWVEHEAIDCDSCGRGRPAYREFVWNEELF